MKSILISIKPKWVAKILNGEKTIEIRKTAPREFYYRGDPAVKPEPIDVYIYCTKTIKPSSDYDWGEFTFDDLPKLGKVIAKFTLREVERVKGPEYAIYESVQIVLSKACMDEESLEEYANQRPFYAYYISDLVIFDKPKELWEFGFHYDAEYCNGEGLMVKGRKFVSLQRPPQSWCYVEVME